MYIGSADLMGRNLDRRVEVVLPIHDPVQLRYLRRDVLRTYWHDTVNNYRLLPDGSYESLASKNPPLDSHQHLLQLHRRRRPPV